jgi:hypothetical protein
MTFDEAVMASGVSRRALQYAIKDGRLKSHFAAGRRRIFVRDLEDFLRGGETPRNSGQFGAAQPVTA